MMLRDLINALKQYDPNRIVMSGFHNPHSYRGFYDVLAFEPTDGYSTIGEMLKCVQSAVDATYEGYKGGKYTMTLDTECWLAMEGHTSEHDRRITLHTLTTNIGGPAGPDRSIEPVRSIELTMKVVDKYRRYLADAVQRGDDGDMQIYASRLAGAIEVLHTIKDHLGPMSTKRGLDQ